MPAVIDTQDFVTAIAAAKTMAYSGNDDPTLAAVVVGSARLELGESGEQESLIFIASDGTSPGQTIFNCEGELPLIKFSIDQADGLATQAKKVAVAVRKADKEAKCSVELSIQDDGETLYMRTLTDGAPSAADSRHYIPLQNVSDFPIIATTARLKASGSQEVLGKSGEDEDLKVVPLESGALQSFTPDVLKKLGAIASVFKQPVELYTRAHPASVVTVTCGGVFRGVLAAHEYNADIDVDEPEVPVVDDFARLRDLKAA
ncbi:Uncharacterised protein (plasmid) [Tsukamurella tyrosinosolvens]|uniref:DNA polymerase-3 subunit beta n=1 Tax=Tsukamurella tyrosinosolvens TaxID=57704 RepID=A0A1H4UIK3_TSUTY|nr:hypothetical protein [Tsukamurella tyrosinosolvens]KXO92917.1 hypothetical protein AXK58_13675 [Tsukamurella tyrosinosolvens]SEC68121.1 hypothetical protein SAMN04489793_2903 [Tsukamurella tyrosinosolvens]VEH94227.1 Uncharacterised protein [Tsukamurella tyrosinosolvens]